ncbi:MAG: peptidase M1 [Salinivirgaceae bacterium]|nr:MAG: peptidase M1 [Salinivirgaceae bacterium]
MLVNYIVSSFVVIKVTIQHSIMKKLLIILLFVPLVGFTQHHEHECAKAKQAKYSKIWDDLMNKEAGNLIDVNYYDIFWNIDPAIDAISGNVDTYFTLLQNSTQITLDLSSNLTVDSILYEGNQVLYTHENDIITINFGVGLSENTSHNVNVFYHGTPSKLTDAFTQSTHDGVPIIWTLSEPYGAKDWWPCKQSLSDKADSIDISINIPDGNKAASNGVLAEVEDNGNWDIYHWQHRHPIATYLVAIAVTNYDEFTNTVQFSDGDVMEILNYVFPEDYDTWVANAETTVTALNFFSDLFIKYPFANEKYGHAQFGWGGGMEHQTMSFMVHLGSSLVVHELAHQWFGDYITCGSWSDIWLNEGFATYCEGLYVEWQQNQELFTNWKRNEMDYVVTQPYGSVFVYDTTDVWNIFSGRLSYSKGAMVLHMIRKQIGDNAFFAAIGNYLNDGELANGFATTPDLMAHFEDEADKVLTEFFNDWIYNEGYPQYNLVWEQVDGKVYFKVSQTQSHTSVDYFEMKIPVLISGSATDTLIWLHNTVDYQFFDVDFSEDVQSVTFDPYVDMVSKNNLVQQGNVVSINNVDNVSVLIYPNPTAESFIIQCNEPIFSVNMYDLGGKVISIETPENPIYTSNLSTGVYFIEVITKTGNKSIQKLMIQ